MTERQGLTFTEQGYQLRFSLELRSTPADVPARLSCLGSSGQPPPTEGSPQRDYEREVALFERQLAEWVSPKRRGSDAEPPYPPFDVADWTPDHQRYEKDLWHYTRAVRGGLSVRPPFPPSRVALTSEQRRYERESLHCQLASNQGLQVVLPPPPADQATPEQYLYAHQLRRSQWLKVRGIDIPRPVLLPEPTTRWRL